jgi:hypothetical protein
MKNQNVLFQLKKNTNQKGTDNLVFILILTLLFIIG